MYHVIVRERDTKREVARYSYGTRGEALDAQSELREVRIKQNHERVTVTVERGE